MILDPFVVLSGLCYLLLGILLLATSLWLFEIWTRFDVRHEILNTQNKALAHIVKWVVVAQGIIITYSWSWDADSSSISPIASLECDFWTHWHDVPPRVTLTFLSYATNGKRNSHRSKYGTCEYYRRWIGGSCSDGFGCFLFLLSILLRYGIIT